MVLHICIGNKTHAEDELARASTTGKKIGWIVPSRAKAGDQVLFYIPGRGLVALGLLNEDASKEQAGDWSNRYGSEVAEISLFRKPVSLESLSKAIPEWRWPAYPRITTTPSESIAQKILEYLRKNSPYSPRLPDLDQPEFAATEGAKRLRTHLARERNQTLVKAKKAQVINDGGRIDCEVCGFDFEAFYGEHGKDYCEVHHLKPLSESDKEIETSLGDLAVVCSNCHRMLHRGGTLKSIAGAQDNHCR